jgi:hypothetical protein
MTCLGWMFETARKVLAYRKIMTEKQQTARDTSAKAEGEEHGVKVGDMVVRTQGPQRQEAVLLNPPKVVATPHMR